MNNKFPGGSKSRVNRAGNNVRENKITDDDLRVIKEWRAAHRPVLNSFQKILRYRTRDTNIYVAQRHKRRSTIFDKLSRCPKMQLARMDDVAGCRLIFEDNAALDKFRKKFHTATFEHKRKNGVDKYDYIKYPKSSGYRGIHDVYSYNVNTATGRHLKGLMVEIQYRTRVQHAWATAVEVIGSITENQPKFQKGDKKYLQAMAYASEILARAHERKKGPHPRKSDKDLVDDFLKLDKQLGLVSALQGLSKTETDFAKTSNYILIFLESGKLKVEPFRTATEALDKLFNLEITMPNADIVLVKAETPEEVRFAFKNYFSDVQEFINLVEDGCLKLSGKQAYVKKLKLVKQKRKRRDYRKLVDRKISRERQD